ncbi:cupredoxin domain-containing protein [Mycobacterium sp. AZCC_0083]|uniref:cupredoxin domain-containing protein n=1 Tax=Mycobacterium sp. AZCC_0083 TaxID=2735882 RepID=UPI0016155DCE|nr:cupredoxin domain-containing protein [Mycobacterium sp. AZCC_0083]MBB5160996.1 plastocyanin [Mycobacterium sp. AZCC_0083]
MTKLHGTVAALGVIALVVAGCGSSGTTGYGATSTAPATSSAANAASGPTITISGMAFGEPVTVSPGAQVAITNGDGVEHSVTSKTAGQFDTEVDANGQKTFTAPTQPGEYPFYCKYHSNMKGTLTVK